MFLLIVKGILLLIPVIWLAVAALVVAACRVAARGDGRAQAEPSG